MNENLDEHRPLCQLLCSVFRTLLHQKATNGQLTPSFILLMPFARAEPSFEMKWTEGRLTVTAEQAPLASIIREVALAVSMDVQGLDWLQQKVSVVFSDLTLAEGLQVLLADVDYVLVESMSPEGHSPAMKLILGQQANRTAEAISGNPLESYANERVPSIEEGPEGGSVRYRIVEQESWQGGSVILEDYGTRE